MMLIGESVLLRNFRTDDWTAVQAYAQLAEVSQYAPWGPNTQQDSKSYIELSLELGATLSRHAFNLAIELRGDGRLIGGCDLKIVSMPFRRGQIGYALHPEHWGRGLATEAARLLLAYGFRDLGLHRIEATCDPRNLASARVLEKAGLIAEGTRRQDVLVRGEWRDSLLFSVLEDQWHSQAA